MAAEQQITEIIIDARGAITTTEQLAAASAVAQRAVDRFTEAQQRAQAANDATARSGQQGAERLLETGRAASTAARSLDTYLGRLDPTYFASRRLADEQARVESAMRALDRQVMTGVRSAELFTAQNSQLTSRLNEVKNAITQLASGTISSAEALKALRTEAERTADKVEAEAAAARELSTAARELVRQLDDTASAQARAAQQIEIANKAHKAGLISTPQYEAALRKFGEAAEGSGKGAKLAAHEVTNLTYQIQDAVVQLAGGQNPLLILMQQGPQATGAVGGVANAIRLLMNPLTVAAVAAALLVTPLALGISRAVELASEARTLAVAIQGMGKAAETSSGQLARMVEQLRQQGIAAAEARKIAIASISSPLVSASRGAQLAALAPDVAAGRQIDVAQAMERLVDAAARGYEGIKALDEAWGFLTDKEADSIRTMTRHGDTVGALNIAVAALRREFDGLHKASLSPLDQALLDLSNNWRRFTTALSETDTVVNIISSLAVALDNLSRALSGDWNRLGKVIATIAEYLPGNPLSASMRAAGGMLDALDSGPKASAPAKPTAADYARARREASGQMPDDPADAQRGKRLSEYTDSMERELSVLRAGLPDRARLRAELAAEDLARKEGFNSAQTDILKRAMVAKAILEETDALRLEAQAMDRANRSALAQAEAWRAGAAAGEQAATAAQVQEMHATRAGVSTAEWTARIATNKAALATLDLAKSNDELISRVTYLGMAIAAEEQSAEAAHQVDLVEKQRLATREARAKLAAEADPAAIKALQAEIDKQEELVRIVDDGEARRADAQTMRAKRQELLLAQGERDIALEADPTKRAAMELALQHRRDEYEIRQRIGHLGEKAVQDQLAMADAVARTRQETERINQIQAKGKELTDDLFNMIEQAGERSGRTFWQSFTDWGRAAIKTLAKEMLFRPIIQPIMTQVVGMVPQLFGIAGSTSAAGGSTGGIGSIMSPITDILGIAKSFVGDTFSSVSSWINGIGASFGLGGAATSVPMAASTALGVAGVPGGVSGTMVGTSISAGPTLTGLLGNFGVGFGAGNLLAGLIGKSNTGSMIGSGLGSAIGAGLSLIPGMQIPGMLLSILGGAGGGLLGGLLGADEQRPLGNAQLGAVKNGRLTFGQTTSLDGYDNSREIQQMQQAVTLVNGIIDKFGLTLDESLLRRGFEDTSNPIGLIGKTSTFDGPANLQEWIQRFFSGREGQSYLKGATGTLGVAFDRLSSGDYKPETGDDVLKMLDYAAGFDDAVKRAAAGVNTLKRQTLEWEIAARDAGKGLAKTVKDYIDQAREYFGEGSTQVNQAAVAQRQSIYSMMNLDTSGNAIDPNAPSDMLTGRAADLAQAKAQIAQYKDALVATGLTAEQAAAAVDRGMAATAAAINARWDEIDRRSNAALTQRQGNAAIIAYGAKSGYTANQMAIDAQAEQQRQELYDAKAGGKSPAEIARIETAQATERAALAEQQLEQARRATESMTDRQNAALVTLGRASEADAQRSSMQARHRQELWDAEHSGMDKASIKMLLHTQQLEDEALAYQQAVQAAQQAAQAAGAFNASITSVAVARSQAAATAAANQLTDANTALATAEQDLNSARSAAASSINEQVSAWTNAANSLKNVREQLLTGNLNPVDRYQQMLLAQGLYQDARAKAPTDPNAAASFGGYAQQYLQAAMAYFGPTEQYAGIFKEVTGALENSESIAQQQARLAQSQLTQLQSIAGSTKSLDEAVAAYTAAQAAKDTAAAAKTSAEAGMNAGLKGQFDTLAGQYSAYMATETPKVGAIEASKNAETAFGGARDAILNAITDWRTLNQIGERYYMHAVGGVADVIRVKVLQLGGTPSFEHGGLHAGGVRLVGERGPELEVTGPARYWSASETRALLAPNAGLDALAHTPMWPRSEAMFGVGRFDLPAMPRAAANDREATAELIAELRELRKQVSSLEAKAEQGNRIAVASGNANIEGLTANARAQRQTQREVKRAGVYR